MLRTQERADDSPVTVGIRSARGKLRAESLEPRVLFAAAPPAFGIPPMGATIAAEGEVAGVIWGLSPVPAELLDGATLLSDSGSERVETRSTSLHRIPRAPLSSATDALYATFGPTSADIFFDETLLHNHGVPYSSPWDLVTLTDGSYVVVWLEPTGSGLNVTSRRFHSDGTPQSDLQRWATFTEVFATYPIGVAATALPTGGYAIGWTRPDGVHIKQITADNVQLGDEVHIASSQTSGEHIDLISTAQGHIFVTWADYNWQNIYGQDLDGGLVPQGSLLTLVQAPVDRLVSRPRLVPTSTSDILLQWIDGPLGSNSLPEGDELPGRGGNGGPTFQFYYQRLSSAGMGIADAVLISEGAISTPPAIALGPANEMAVLESTIAGLETQVTLKLFNTEGILDRTYILATSRFLSHMAPSLTLLGDDGFLATYGVPYADGPIIMTQQFNRAARFLGPVRQFNVGDDVGFPPAVHVGAIADGTYVVVWPHQLIGGTETAFVARTSRLARTPLHIVVPDSLQQSWASDEVIVRLSGLPETAEFTAGFRHDLTSWDIPLEDLAKLQWIGPPPESALLLSVDFLDAATDDTLLSQMLWIATDGDDTLLPVDDTPFFSGGGGTDTFVIQGNRELYRATLGTDGTLQIRNASTNATVWELQNFERIRFADIVLPVEYLLPGGVNEDYFATYTSDEDITLVIDTVDGVLATTNVSSGTQVLGNSFAMALPNHGVLQLLDDGSFTFVPLANWSGSTTWSFDTRPMAFHGGVPAENDAATFVAEHGTSLPALDFAALPNPLITGRSYTVTVNIASVVANDVLFGFSLLGGGSLVADETDSAIIESDSSGTRTFHFTKLPAHAGLTVFSDGASDTSTGQLKFSDVRIVDDTTGEVVVNTAIRDYNERTVKLDVNAVADAPTITAEMSPGEIGVPTPINILSSLTDLDGSETLQVWLTGLPVGTLVTDGTNSQVTTSPTNQVDISSWTIDDIQLTVEDDESLLFELTILAAATESSNLDQSLTQLPLAVELSPRAPGPDFSSIPVIDTDPFPSIGLDDWFASAGGPRDGGSLFNDLFGGGAPFGDGAFGTGQGGPFGDGGELFGGLDLPLGPFLDLDNLPGPDQHGPDGEGDEPPSPPDNSAESNSVEGDNEPVQASAEQQASDVAENDAAAQQSAASAGTNQNLQSPDSNTPQLPIDYEERLHSGNGLAASAVASEDETPAELAGHATDTPETRSYIVSGTDRVAAIFAADELWHEMDSISQDVNAALPMANVVVGSAVVVASGFSAAQVLWLLRGSVLVTKLMSSMPMWVAFDPLPVLDAQTARASRTRNRIRSESLADIASSHL